MACQGVFSCEKKQRLVQSGKRKVLMTEFEKFQAIIARLREPDGCPWDREQTHSSLKAPVIEEAAEVLCGISILEKTGDAENLKEELGDLLLQIVMHAQIAEEEGLFTMDDVIQCVTEKMIRRHPHVFGNEHIDTSGAVLNRWDPDFWHRPDPRRAFHSPARQFQRRQFPDSL